MVALILLKISHATSAYMNKINDSSVSMDCGYSAADHKYVLDTVFPRTRSFRASTMEPLLTIVMIDFLVVSSFPVKINVINVTFFALT